MTDRLFAVRAWYGNGFLHFHWQALSASSDPHPPFVYQEALATEVGRDRWRRRATSSRLGYAFLDHFCSPPPGVSSFRDVIGVYRLARQRPQPDSLYSHEIEEGSTGLSSAASTAGTSPAAASTPAPSSSSSSSEEDSRGFVVAVRSYAGTLAAYLVPLAVGLVLLLVVLPLAVLLATGICCCPSKGGVCWGCGGCCLRCWCLLKRTPSSPSFAPEPCRERSSTERSTFSTGHHGSYRLARDRGGAPFSSGSSCPVSEGGDSCPPGLQGPEASLSYTRVSTGTPTSSPPQQTRELHPVASRRYSRDSFERRGGASLWVLRPSVRVFGVALTIVLICGVAACIIFAFLFTARLHQAVDDTHCAVGAASVQLFYGGLGPPSGIESSRPDRSNSTSSGLGLDLIAQSEMGGKGNEGSSFSKETRKDVLFAGSSLVASPPQVSMSGAEVGTRHLQQQGKGRSPGFPSEELFSADGIRQVLASFLSGQDRQGTSNGGTVVPAVSRVLSYPSDLLDSEVDNGEGQLPSLRVSNASHEFPQSDKVTLRTSNMLMSVPSGRDFLSALSFPQSNRSNNTSLAVPSSSPLLFLSELANSSAPASSVPHGVRDLLRTHNISTDAVRGAAQAVVDVLGDSPSSRMLVRHAAALLGVHLPRDSLAASHRRTGQEKDESGRATPAPGPKVVREGSEDGLEGSTGVSVRAAARSGATSEPASGKDTPQLLPKSEAVSLHAAGRTPGDSSPLKSVGQGASVGSAETQQSGGPWSHVEAGGGSVARRLSSQETGNVRNSLVGTLAEELSQSREGMEQGEKAVKPVARLPGKKDKEEPQDLITRWSAKALSWVRNLVSGLVGRNPGKDHVQSSQQQSASEPSSSPPPAAQEAGLPLKREDVERGAVSASDGEERTVVPPVVPVHKRGSDDYSPGRIGPSKSGKATPLSQGVSDKEPVSSGLSGQRPANRKASPEQSEVGGPPHRAEPSSSPSGTPLLEKPAGPSSSAEGNGFPLPVDDSSTEASPSGKASVVLTDSSTRSVDGAESVQAYSEARGEGTGVGLPSPEKAVAEDVATGVSPSSELDSHATSQADRAVSRLGEAAKPGESNGQPRESTAAPSAGGRDSAQVPATEAEPLGLRPVSEESVVVRELQEKKRDRESDTKRGVLSVFPRGVVPTEESGGGSRGGGQAGGDEDKRNKVESSEGAVETGATALEDTATMTGGFVGLKPALKM